MANLQKVIKLTQAQYDTLAAGGTVGQYTGLNDNYIYLVKDTNTYATEDYVDSEIDDLASRISNSYVRYDINSQGLTDTQKSNARTNIGAGTYSKPSTGIPAGDLDAATRATLVKASNLTVSATNGVSDGTSTYKYTHPSYSVQTAGLYKIGRDSTGHVTIGDAFTIPTKTSDLTNDSGFVTSDTKNTAGSTNDTSLLYLIGAKTQEANPQTYSKNNTYINANGVLVNTTGFSSYSYATSSGSGLLNIGTNAVNYYSGSGPASFKATSSTHGSWQINDNNTNIYIQKTGGSASSGNAYLLFPNVGTSSAPKTIATTDDAAKVVSAEFVEVIPPGFNVTIVIANSRHTSEWTSTIVYDDNPNTHEIGRFSSANGTLTVNTETGVIDVVFDGGMVYISPAPTVTSGITIDYGDSSHYRFNVVNSGTITFDGNINWDD